MIAFVYTRPLGRKHNPTFLLHLAQQCKIAELVVVVEQGFGILVAGCKSRTADAPMTLLPLQPAEHLTDMLAMADVLIATIEAEAGTFAVPSKVLSYLCAGRPILLAAASENNLAARTVKQANAGIVWYRRQCC